MRSALLHLRQERALVARFFLAATAASLQAVAIAEAIACSFLVPCRARFGLVQVPLASLDNQKARSFFLLSHSRKENELRAITLSLPLARRAWPSLPDHKLPTLAEHIGVHGGAHRGLADSKAALAVLLAARAAVK